MARDSASLKEIIASRIEREGPIDFSLFMELALYHPDHGYYTGGKARIGERDADFVTAPHMGALFAKCIARLVSMADRALGEPENFTLVEGGPGEGVLALGVLDALEQDHIGLYGRLTYVADEISPALALRQTKILAKHAARLSNKTPKSYVGLHFSNELIDAMPVHWAGVAEEGGAEPYLVRVAAGKEGFVQEEGPIKDPTLLEEARRLGELHPGSGGYRYELNTASAKWLQRTSGQMERGFIVAVDYGDLEERLYGPQRPEGTVRAFTGGGFGESVLDRPGEIDLTSSVNFSLLFKAAETVGLKTLELMNQRDLLFALGIAKEMMRMEDEASDEVEEMELRQKLWPLIFGGTGMGESFKTFVAAKGITVEELGLDPEAALAGMPL